MSSSGMPASGGMPATVEGKIAVAQTLKNEGNEKFEKCDYIGAFRVYSRIPLYTNNIIKPGHFRTMFQRINGDDHNDDCPTQQQDGGDDRNDDDNDDDDADADADESIQNVEFADPVPSDIQVTVAQLQISTYLNMVACCLKMWSGATTAAAAAATTTTTTAASASASSPASSPSSASVQSDKARYMSIAWTYVQKALAIDPVHTKALFRRGQISLRRGDWQAAQVDFSIPQVATAYRVQITKQESVLLARVRKREVERERRAFAGAFASKCNLDGESDGNDNNGDGDDEMKE